MTNSDDQYFKPDVGENGLSHGPYTIFLTTAFGSWNFPYTKAHDVIY